MNLEEIKVQTLSAVREVCEKSHLKSGDLLVIGCSTSEIGGGVIGKNSSADLGKAVFETVNEYLTGKGIFLAAQCCEHLNRALIIEREAQKRFGYEEVCVVPQPKAGGSFATAAYYGFKDPVAVEQITADAGMDIGLTLIGMHLKRVAVPLRLTNNRIGEALVCAAYTRPRYIGGCRAAYEPLK